MAFRVPDGDSENSDAAEAFSISQFDKNDIELSELVKAANDPQRVRCLTELDPDYTVPLRTTLNQPNKRLFNNFVDEMFNQLAQPHRTTNNELIFIKASQATVMNIARAFAQSRLLDIDLAKRTRAFYVEPEKPADHHGANGAAQETDLSWRTRGHLPDLSQNELGISCQDPC